MRELILLCAADSFLYSRTFFPKTVRQESPPFHRKIWNKFEGPSRLVALMLFRGSAKTTLTRVYLSKRIAYGISHTIVVVGKSQDHAKRTVSWLMNQVDFNKKWADTFGLRRGKKWTNEEIEIYHGTDEMPITVIAVGITGSTRGINVDDYRPDLIFLDDPSDEENTATPEQREKTDNFIMGSLKNSLAPESEAPHAKMIFAQTLLDEDDSISRCEGDPSWDFMKQSCFDERGESVWPTRYPTSVLMEEKIAMEARSKLSLWLREMECVVASPETSAFQKPIIYYDRAPDVQDMDVFLGIDPVPPPSEKEIAQGLRHKDFECHAVIGRWYSPTTKKPVFYLLDYEFNKGHDPTWSINTFFYLCDKWSVRLVVAESVAYQRTLKWLLEQAMKQRHRFIPIEAANMDGNRRKAYRIIDIVGTVVADYELRIAKHHQEYAEQYRKFPNVAHDDIIDAASIALRAAMGASGMMLEGEYERLEAEERDLPELDFGGCP